MINNNPMKDKNVSKKVAETLINNGINIRTYKYKDTNLNYQSSYEYNFLEFCESYDILNEISNAHSFKYLNEDSNLGYFYLPDFIYKGKYIIEIKSEWIKKIQGGNKKLNAKKRCVEYNGYTFILLMDNNFSKFKSII